MFPIPLLFAILFLSLLYLQPATPFLVGTSTTTRNSNNKVHQLRQRFNPPATTRALSYSTSITRLFASVSNATEKNVNALLEAKLQVLQDVVVKLNATKWQDQEQIQALTLQLADIQDSLHEQTETLRQTSKSHKREVNSLKLKFEKEKESLSSSHQQELVRLERSLTAKAKLRQDEIEQALRKETKEWKVAKQQEFDEALEIATAAVTAAEQREHVLQQKVDNLEARYHQEAAQYKTELDDLQVEWKLENQRLELEIKRLQKDLANSKREKDQESAMLIEKLSVKSKELEAELQKSKDQLKFQRLQLTTQQQVAYAEWEEQRNKERKFYKDAMNLLQRENTALREQQTQNRGFWWTRLFRRFVGKRSSLKQKNSRTARPNGMSNS